MDDLINDIAAVNSTETEIAYVFFETKYAPFVKALSERGITNFFQLSKVNIFAFLNENNISFGDKRYQLLKEINSTIEIYFSEFKAIDLDPPMVMESGNDKEEDDSITITATQKLMDQLEIYLKKQKDKTVTIDDVMKALKVDNHRRIGKILSEVSWAVEIENGKFKHRYNITDMDEASEKILLALRKLFVRNSGYASAKQLFDEVKVDLEFFMFENNMQSQEYIYRLAVHLFTKEKYKGNKFLFYNRMHIWEKEPDYPKSYVGLIVKWARERDNVISKEIAVKELENIGAANPAFAFYIAMSENRDLFWQFAPFKYVLREVIDIDEHWLNLVKKNLEDLLADKPYAIPGDIVEHWFLSLPILPHNLVWSPLLLQDVLRHFDLGFKTIPAGEGQDSDVVHAALVRNNSEYKNFGDVVWHIVDEEIGTPRDMKSEELRQLLLKKKLLKGNERLWSLHKAIPVDHRFIWHDDNMKVLIS